jgi:hypothetical protein
MMSAKPTRRRLPLPLYISLLTVIAAAAVMLTTRQPPAPPRIMATADPAVAMMLTQLPQSEPLTGAAAEELRAFEVQVIACRDYRPARRDQMRQHIHWLLNPADIPPQVILALGANPTARLLFGMADYTASEWRLNQRPADSCLRQIGLRLNQMLLAAGEEPLTLYEENAG